MPILSRISSKEEAIVWCRNKGPCFGLQDLCIKPLSNVGIICESRQHSYEKKIINREIFEIEEYERRVFRFKQKDAELEEKIRIAPTWAMPQLFIGRDLAT
ncbi:hypothetical protein RhiirC2_715611 [Rhizophagus irregularis]|uniref:Uncharacterized protein n=1 Tax=Rhizophagus irregularis TaxID=588596 RepID=A0A2N1MUS3_9GLOM|nr:hypothetical protein RhiirC2_715879 [Rhizophagus irregularis]PKK65357.1 hypothetical protein RhiirC2_715611 [Rhizophagus irregularis]